MTESLRLAKQVATQIGCSRREAELYIENGAISVDGHIIDTVGYRVSPNQIITLMPGASCEPAPPVTLLFHKPSGIEIGEGEEALTQLIGRAQHDKGDRARIAVQSRHFKALTLAMPLSTLANGLLVLTQDFRIARKLVEDVARVEQEFLVEVSGKIVEGGLAKLNRGGGIGHRFSTLKVSWQNETRLRFAFKSPHAGQVEAQITALCQHVGLQIVAIKRLRMGRISLSNLPLGNWRYLLDYERF